MRITGRTRLAGIMGWPVAHSRSPALHNFWLDEQGVDGAYVPLPVRPEDLARALLALPALGFRGCNLTIPHKQMALSVVDRVEPLARRIGAMNTVIVCADGSLEGRNTDVFGFRESLREGAPDWEPTGGPGADRDGDHRAPAGEPDARPRRASSRGAGSPAGKDLDPTVGGSRWRARRCRAPRQRNEPRYDRRAGARDRSCFVAAAGGCC